jgi:hypothetical protein
MGKQRLKNIARPIRTYAVTMDGLPARSIKTSPARRYLWIGAAIILVLVAGGKAITWWSEPTSTGNAELAVSEPPAPPAPISEPSAPPAPAPDAIVWDVIKDGAAADPFAAFLRTYPNSQYAAAARDKLAELARAATARARRLDPGHRRNDLGDDQGQHLRGSFRGVSSDLP